MIPALRNPQTTIQVVTLAVFIGALVYLIVWANRDDTRWRWASLVLGVILHNIVYYAYLFCSFVFPSLPTGFFGFWSAVRALHAGVTFLIFAYVINRLNGKLDHRRGSYGR